MDVGVTQARNEDCTRVPLFVHRGVRKVCSLADGDDAAVLDEDRITEHAGRDPDRAARDQRGRHLVSEGGRASFHR
jgi:hypothetical protein